MDPSMMIPLKPWETTAAANNFPYSQQVPQFASNPNRLHSSAVPYPGSGGGSIATNQIPSNSLAPPPPLPPRPAQARPIYSAYNRSSMMPYGSSPYGMGMGSSLYSPYSSYNSYGGMGGGYGGMSPYGGNRMYGSPYGPQQEEYSFSQMAEESASSAFQSIESFVSAFGSISAMLDSTFHALYSSFRAVIGVADHLGRVKQIVSALAVFRFFKWVFRRFLYLIGISKIKPADVESLWNNLSTSAEGGLSDPADILRAGGGGIAKPSSWPIIMFLGFIFAGPYLMWKLIKSLNLDPSQKDDRGWATGESEHFIATAEFQFDPMTDRELQLRPGQTIRLAPAKCQPPDVKGWVLASDGQKIGLVPTNYIKIKGKKSRDTRPLLNMPQQDLPLCSSTNPLLLNNNPALNPANVSALPQVNITPTNYNTAEPAMENRPHSSGDSAAVSSDDDTDTLVGDPFDGED